MTTIDPHDRPTAAEERPHVVPPMWVVLRVCECGRVGAWAGTRCGENGRHNMRSSCPTVEVPYMQAEPGDIPEGM